MKKIWQRIGCLLLVALVLFSVPANAFALDNSIFRTQYQQYLQKNNLVETGAGATDIVYCAKAMLGKTGKDVASKGQWCASFVSCCARTVGQSAAIPYNTGVKTICTGIKKAGGTVIYDGPNKKGNVANALPGDIVAYKTSATWGHVEIVSKAVSNKKITSIGGNTGNSNHSKAKVQERSWATSKITYIIRPKYTNASVLPVTVTFNANGGTVAKTSMSATIGQTYGTLPTPVWANHIFDDWFDAANGGNQVKDSTKVTKTSNHTLYAHWAAVEKSTAKVYHWKQTDSKWSGKYSGFTWKSACAVVAIAAQIARTDLVRVDEAATSYNTTTRKGFNPATFAKVAVSKGVISSGASIKNWKNIKNVVPGFNWAKKDYKPTSKWSYGNRVFSYYPAKSKQNIVDAMTYYLTNGYYPIIEGPGSKWKSTTNSRHYVAVVSTTATDVFVMDPATGTERSLFSLTNWTVANINKCGVPSGYGCCMLYTVDKNQLLPSR